MKVSTGKSVDKHVCYDGRHHVCDCHRTLNDDSEMLMLIVSQHAFVFMFKTIDICSFISDDTPGNIFVMKSSELTA